MAVLSKAMYRFDTAPLKLPRAFFSELEQKNLNICMQKHKTSNSFGNLEKEK